MNGSTSDNGHIGGLVIFGLLMAAGVYSCSEKPKEEREFEPQPIAESLTVPSPVATSLPSFDPPPRPPSPSHNYESVEEGVYYYLAAVSEEDRKRGVRASSALGFRYLGRNEDNEDIVFFVDERTTSYCRRPCKIIRWDSGRRLGFDEGSIIGAVYADVMRGYLKKYTPPQPKRDPASSEPPSEADPNPVMDDITE